MLPATRRALLLAGVQAVDLAVTQLSPRYGHEHLGHLGVPLEIRPVLPAVKAAAVGALLATAKRARPRSLVACALVAYYSAAATFHVLAKDPLTTVSPAAGCAVLSASLV